MIGATLTTRLKQGGIDKSTITAFTLVFLAYNFKFLWAWIVDGVRLPLLGRLGQRVSWMLVTGALVIAAVANLALVDPRRASSRSSTAAILVGDRRCELRHRDRRLPDRNPRAAAARRRLGHVAIWLAHRLGRGRRASRWSSRPAAAGRRPTSPAPPSRCRRCSLPCSSASPSGTASPPSGRAFAAPSQPSGGRSSNSSSARARCSCCSSSCSTRSATRWRT